jgi:hypothetical protein
MVTSRPELPICPGFEDIVSKYKGLVLYRLSNPIVEHDILKRGKITENEK